MTVFRSLHVQRTYRPLREQAHSYRGLQAFPNSPARHKSRRSELAREDCIPVIASAADVPAFSRASSLLQGSAGIPEFSGQTQIP